MEKEAYTYDVIVIGGGATGSGIALDASLRGYKTLLIEQSDFASGTSSKSTKLVHGGVRYLEKAILQLSPSQLKLVLEGLQERHYFLENASHLTHKLPITTPFYSFFEGLYLRLGLLLYDLLSFSKSIGKSDYVKKELLLHEAPYLKKNILKGGINFYDGAFNDTRMVIALLQTAQQYGATVKNYEELTGFLYDTNKLCGIKTKDTITKNENSYYAKAVINAAGFAVDKIRKLDDNTQEEILELSSGIHIILEGKYLPSKRGILIPKTSDGRVIFVLPYHGFCLIGTTDNSASYTTSPKVSKDEVDYLLHHLNDYFDIELSSKDVLSSFSGLRPLIKQKETSSNIVREHEIYLSKSGLISIAGGKWTTYRKMAEECLDFAIEHQKLSYKKPCETKHHKLIGSQKDLSIEMIQTNKFDEQIKQAMISRYGDKTNEVLEVAISNKKEQLLNKEFSIIEGEVLYAIKYEFVKKPLDFIMRRVNLGFIHKQAAKKILARVTEIMAFELNWSDETTLINYQEALKELNEIL